MKTFLPSLALTLVLATGSTGQTGQSSTGTSGTGSAVSKQTTSVKKPQPHPPLSKGQSKAKTQKAVASKDAHSPLQKPQLPQAKKTGPKATSPAAKQTHPKIPKSTKAIGSTKAPIVTGSKLGGKVLNQKKGGHGTTPPAKGHPTTKQPPAKKVEATAPSFPVPREEPISRTSTTSATPPTVAKESPPLTPTKEVPKTVEPSSPPNTNPQKSVDAGSTGTKTDTPTTTSPPKQARVKTISNVFTDADVKTVIQEMANSSGASIIADTSVKGLEISLEFKKDTVETALEKLSYATGVLWKKKGEVYIVSLALPESPLFFEFAQTKVYTPHTQPAENLYGLLTKNFLTYAMLDKAANMISVTAPAKQMDQIWKALEAADSPRKQFVVEAMVTEISNQRMKNTGFSWDWKHFGQGSDLSMTYTTATAADIATLKSLITTNQASLRANPKMVSQEGHEANLTVGTESYFALVTGNAQYQTVQYQKINAGITLKFTGFIEPDGMVNLHLQPEVSDAVTLVNGSPQTTVRRADTFVRIKFGDTIALGGLIVGKVSNQVTKVPLLGDIPLLGQAFRTSNKDKIDTEVIILITPRLIQDAKPDKPATDTASGTGH